MKAKGLRVFGVLVILVGIIAGVVALLLSNGDPMGIVALGLSVLIGVVIACVLFTVANNKEKRERIRASMEAVEDATVLDPIEEPVIDDVVLDETEVEIEELPEFNPEEALEVEPVEEVELPKTKYQILRDKIVEHTPITYEQLDKAEKVGKVAIPVAAATAVVLMVAKLASYRKQEIRRRTFFDWLG
ncbi:MAG: hypothetical protein J6Q70_03625 [Clostridia bacterium]|nr:hypothetical protein [Clostridia bacterium]